MKTIQLISNDDTITVDYLVDLIGNNEECTVYQIKDHAATSQTGAVRLSAAAIQANFPDSIDEFNKITDFKVFALANGMKMTIFENGESDVVETPNTATDIVKFSFPDQTGAATIDAVNHTVAIEVANGTDASALTATFTLSYGAAADISDTEQVSGTTENNFSSPVTYTITAGDETTEQDWVVTVTVAS